jgi:hypothetical protein
VRRSFPAARAASVHRLPPDHRREQPSVQADLRELTEEEDDRVGLRGLSSMQRRRNANRAFGTIATPPPSTATRHSSNRQTIPRTGRDRRPRRLATRWRSTSFFRIGRRDQREIQWLWTSGVESGIGGVDAAQHRHLPSRSAAFPVALLHLRHRSDNPRGSARFAVVRHTLFADDMHEVRQADASFGAGQLRSRPLAEERE